MDKPGISPEDLLRLSKFELAPFQREMVEKLADPNTRLVLVTRARGYDQWTKRLIRAMVYFEQHHQHIMVAEQQTGHLVCSWCSHCDGSCRYPSRLMYLTSNRREYK